MTAGKQKLLARRKNFEIWITQYKNHYKRNATYDECKAWNTAFNMGWQARRQAFVYVVGHHGPEHNHIEVICESESQAKGEFEKVRKVLLKEAKDSYERTKKECGVTSFEMYERMIKNLSERNPNIINNYPHETPYIQKYELKGGKP